MQPQPPDKKAAKRPRYQFRLGTALLAITVLAFWLALPLLQDMVTGWLIVLGIVATLALLLQGPIFLLLWALGFLPRPAEKDTTHETEIS